MGPLQVGTTLSQKYRIVRLMAESNGIILYEATDTARSQRVWVKILRREALTNTDALERFHREEKSAKVLETGKSPDGLPFLVSTDNAAPAVPMRGPRSTLPGVAPPPMPMRRLELAPEPVEAEPIPLVVEAPAAAPAKPPPPAPDPVLKKRQRAPTLIIQRPKKSVGWTWAAIFFAVATATGIGGWYMGHGKSRPAATKAVEHPPPPVVTPHEPAPSFTPAPTPLPSTTASTTAEPTQAPTTKPRPRPRVPPPPPPPLPKPTSEGPPLTL